MGLPVKKYEKKILKKCTAEWKNKEKKKAMIL